MRNVLLVAMLSAFSMPSFAGSCGVSLPNCPDDNPNSACNLSLRAQRSVLSIFCSSENFRAGCSQTTPHCAQGDIACQWAVQSQLSMTHQYCQPVARSHQTQKKPSVDPSATTAPLVGATAPQPRQDQRTQPKQQTTPMSAFDTLSKPLTGSKQRNHAKSRDSIKFKYY